jgi:hypothetical protein
MAENAQFRIFIAHNEYFLSPCAMDLVAGLTDDHILFLSLFTAEVKQFIRKFEFRCMEGMSVGPFMG